MFFYLCKKKKKKKGKEKRKKKGKSMQCQEKVLHCFPSIVEKIPIILLKQEEPWYNKTIEMARRLDLMSLRYAMALFFETTLF